MENSNQERDHLAEHIVKNHVAWASGAGLIWIPFADILAVTGIQLDMIRQLCHVYDVDFKDTRGKAIVSALSGTSAARLGASAIKAIPGIGTIAGGLTMSALSGATTYAIGYLFMKHFQTGGTLLDFDIERVKKTYDDLFEKGQEYIEHIKDKQKEATPEAPKAKQDNGQLDELDRLFQLKEKGAISDEEYEVLKARILEK
jgi:uncharacterized protein (DUF697 family)